MAEDDFIRALGRRIAKLRHQHNFSQERLAAETGLDRVAIAYIETGKRKPNVTSLFKIAQALEIDMAELFTDL